MPAPTSDPRIYWLAVHDSEQAASNALERIRRYEQGLEQRGRTRRIQSAISTYHGLGPDGQGDTSRTMESGRQNELVEATTNKFSVLVIQTTVRTTQNKPAFKAVASNSDAASLESTSFAQRLLEYYSELHSLQDRDYETVECGNVCGEGWQIHSWDATKGKNLTDFFDGPAVREGDIDVQVATPLRVAYDLDCEQVERMEWFAFKRRVPRHALAASIAERYPEASRKLLEMGGGQGIGDDYMRGLGSRISSWDARRDALLTGDDNVWVWEVRHLPSPALPNGRLLRFVTAECVVFDSFEQGEEVKDHGYPYSELHAYRYAPAKRIGEVDGLAPGFDLLSLQQLKDTVYTAAASALNAGAVTNLWMQTGDKPAPTLLAGSLNFIQSKSKPETLEGPQLSPQVQVIDQMLDRAMLERMGESDVSMGNVPKGMPGNLAALLEAKTVQYHSRGQSSYALMLSRSRTGMLKLLQRFATSERVAMLGGVGNQFKFETWSNQKLQGFERFAIEQVSPTLQNFVGRGEVAKELMANQMIESPQQYLTFLDTGRLEPMLESQTTRQLAVKRERELLMKGIGLPPIEPPPPEALMQGIQMPPKFVDDGQPHVRPVAYDHHWEHIIEDRAVLDIPGMKERPEVVEAVTGVIAERIRFLRLLDPVMLALLGCPEKVLAALSGGQGLPPSVPPGAGEPPPSTMPPAEGLPEGAPPIPKPKPAKPPPDPLTGQQAPSPVEA